MWRFGVSQVHSDAGSLKTFCKCSKLLDVIYSFGNLTGAHELQEKTNKHILDLHVPFRRLTVPRLGQLV